MTEPIFKAGDTVVRKAVRDTIGTITNTELQKAGTQWLYPVRFGNSFAVEWVYENDLEQFLCGQEPYELFLNGIFANFKTFQRLITVQRILHPLIDTYFSMFASRTDFLSFQFIPLLKFLKSPDQRLLIADEVGLGKTIEAGIIMLELIQRQSIDKFLIVCPSALREKWFNEIGRKFGKKLEIYDSTSFQQAIKEDSLSGIVSIETIRTESVRDNIENAEFGVDFLIVDEAHHLRNSTSQGHKIIFQIAEHSDAIIFLTATPIHISTTNLFNLLRILSPGEFFNENLFNSLLQKHSECLKNIRLLRKNKPADPAVMVEQEIRLLQNSPLSHIITRTRKSETGLKTIKREAIVKKFHYSPDEKSIYTRVIDSVYNNTQKYGYKSNQTFASIMKQRKIASCIFAEDNQENPEISELNEFEEILDDNSKINIEFEDSKYKELMQVLIKNFNVNPNSKVIIFSYFVFTIKYLYEKLLRDGYRCVAIYGDVTSNPLNPAKDERGKLLRNFLNSKEINILLSTEVGSEGLDMQVADTIINYDLPWNPMVVEQRIGRLDRYGRSENSSQINIVSLVAYDTIEEIILDRLYERIRIFENSIGDLKTILGEVANKLREDFFVKKLSKEELSDLIENEVDNIERERIRVNNLEVNSPNLFAFNDLLENEIQHAKITGKYISADNLKVLLEDFIEGQLNRTELSVSRDSMKIKVGQDFRQLIVNNLYKYDKEEIRNLYDSLSIGEFNFSLNYKYAKNHPEIEFVSTRHPLINIICKEYEKKPETISPVAKILLKTDINIAEGWYSYGVFRTLFDSTKKRNYLDFLVLDISNLVVCSQEVNDNLLKEILIYGESNNKANPFTKDDLNQYLKIMRDFHSMIWEKREQEFKLSIDSMIENRIEIIEKSSIARIDQRKKWISETNNSFRKNMLERQIRKCELERDQLIEKLEKQVVKTSKIEIGFGLIYILKK